MLDRDGIILVLQHKLIHKLLNLICQVTVNSVQISCQINHNRMVYLYHQQSFDTMFH